MNKDLILKSDVLDIVFENRNKAYGAYELRKQYGGRMNKALGMMLGIAAALSAFAFLPHRHTPNALPRTIKVEMGRAEQPRKNEKPPEAKTTPPPKRAQVKLTKQIVITKNTDPTDIITEIKDNTAIGNMTIKDPGPTPPQLVTPVNTNVGTGTEPVKPVVDKNQPVNNPEIMPAFPGGMEALRNFLQKNLTNPRDMDAEEVVTVKVRFIVGYDGKLRGFVEENQVEAAFYNEVVRVLKKMPDWIPGKTNGEAVSVNYMIPVKFISAAE